MTNYNDVKIGDEVFEIVRVGINDWQAIRFCESFYISKKVIKVTPTQFTTDTGMYKKTDGYAIGNSKSIYKKGESPVWGRKTPATKCEKQQMSEYSSKLQIIRDATHFDFRKLNILSLTLEKAQEVASLTKKIKSIVEECK